MEHHAMRAGVLALGLLLAGAAGAQGWPGHDMMGEMRGGYGGGVLARLDLTGEQEEKIYAIREDHRRKNWDAMGQLRAEQFKLRRMYGADKVDPGAFAEQQKAVDELRRRMVRSHLEVRGQIEGVLTPEQRKQFRQYGPWWMREADQEQ
jgi:Spy/CpxP family protein refolding chaperone